MCFASLNFTSTDTEDNITTVHIPQANLTIMGNLITFNLCDAAQLTPDCDYNVSVTATNVEGREISYIILSKRMFFFTYTCFVIAVSARSQTNLFYSLHSSACDMP